MMLVLTRKLNEAIIIRGDIRVCIIEIRGEQIRLGIDAPDDVSIDREEVHQRKVIERRQDLPANVNRCRGCGCEIARIESYCGECLCEEDGI